MVSEVGSGRPTPAQLHLGRNVRDEVATRVEQCQLDWNEVQNWRQIQKDTNAVQYNKHAKDLPELNKGDRVFVSVHGKWRRAVIENKATRPRSYQLRLSDTGARIERNRIHVRIDKTKVSSDNTMLYFFSADEKQQPREQQQSPERRHRIEGPEEPPSTSQCDEPPSSEAPVPNAEKTTQTKKQKKSRTDLEQAFLEKQHQSRYGREGKKVVKYDPSGH
jgi:hypothetical protein